MRLTVLGGGGAWPAAGQACSGYLVEREGFRLLVDPGYATLPRLPALPVYALPGAVDAVLALDRPGLLDQAYVVREIVAGDRLPGTEPEATVAAARRSYPGEVTVAEPGFVAELG